MPANKSQHFVPRFLLREFAVGAKKRAIHVFDVASGKVTVHASLKGQAAKDYLYGRDLRLEGGFAAQEERASAVLRKVLRELRLPLSGSPDRRELALFVVQLQRRTVTSLEETKSQLGQVSQWMAESFPREPTAQVETCGAGTSNVPDAEALRLMEAFIEVGHFGISDLRMILFVNRTTTPFITSDHPVVFHNQLGEMLKLPGGNTGVCQEGLQIFLPLSPGVCLCLYDRQAYDCTTKNLCSDLTGGDVDQINALQYLNADRCVYFGETCGGDYLVRLREAYKTFRIDDRVIVQPMRLVSEGGARDPDDAVMTFREDIACGFDLRAMTVSRAALVKARWNRLYHPRSLERTVIQLLYEKRVGRFNGSVSIWDFAADEGLQRDLATYRRGFAALRRSGHYTYEEEFLDYLGDYGLI